jgi:hypothetical protein
MKITVLIPTCRNDGTKIDDLEMDGIRQGIWGTFGGSTNEGIAEGDWIDQATGQHYRDLCLKIAVHCETTTENLVTAEGLIREIGKQLGQKAMWFELQYFDGVRILKID